MRDSHAGRRWAPVFLALVALAALHATDIPSAVAAGPEAPQQRAQPQSREFERDVKQFLEHYRQFLACCAADPDAIPRVKALEGQASALLAQAQTGVASELKKLRGFTVQELLAPVERVRDDLRAIRKRLEQIQEAEDKLEAQDLDFFTFWSERRKLQDALAAIPLEFQAPRRPAGPPAGMDIGVTPPMGPEIGTVPPTGPEAGASQPTGKEIGTTPPTGREIGTTPPTGKEIGTTPPTGPEIGEPRPKR
jgi:hypothetical protein